MGPQPAIFSPAWSPSCQRSNAGATGHQQRRQTLQQRIDEQSPRAEATAACRDKPPVQPQKSSSQSISLSVKTDDRNFIIRQLFRDSY